MTQPEQRGNSSRTQEDAFIQSSLAAVEKSARLYHLKLMGVRGLAVVAAAWFGFKNFDHETLQGVECTILIMTGVMISVATTQIRWQNDRNARDILKAIAQSRRRE